MAKAETAVKTSKKPGKKDERPIIANDEAAKAMKILQAEAQKRAQACAKEIEEVLKRHNCQIVASPMLHPQYGTLHAHWTIQPQQRQADRKL